MSIPFIDLSFQTRAVVDRFLQQLQPLAASNRFIGGRQVEAFEKSFARFCRVPHCVALNSGTDALRLGLRALGLRAPQQVVTSPFSFIATAEAIREKASLVLADVDLQTFNLDPQAVEASLTPDTRVILPVHIFGLPAAMQELSSIAARNSLILVEDACQAHGAQYKGKMAGSLGHLAAFSFYPTKNLGAFGDAGALTCSDPELERKVRLLRNHGQTGFYEHADEGVNSRMDALQALLLNLKMEFLSEWVEMRRMLAAVYRSELEQLGEVQFQREPEGVVHAYHLLAARVERREELSKFLREQGIETRPTYPTPLHRQEAYRHLDLPAGSFPNAELICQTVLCFPLYPGLTVDRAAQVARQIKRFYVG